MAGPMTFACPTLSIRLRGLRQARCRREAGFQLEQETRKRDGLSVGNLNRRPALIAYSPILCPHTGEMTSAAAEVGGPGASASAFGAAYCAEPRINPHFCKTSIA